MSANLKKVNCGHLSHNMGILGSMSNSQVVRSLQPRLPQLKYPQVSIRTAAQFVRWSLCRTFDNNDHIDHNANNGLTYLH